MSKDVRVRTLTVTQKRWLVVAVASMLAMGSVAAFGESASATPATQPVPDGIYIDSPWVLPGGEVYINLNYSTQCIGSMSVSFVDSHGSTDLVFDQGTGGDPKVVLFKFPDNAIGATGPDSGDLVVTCGGSKITPSLPLTVSPTQPSTIYNSSTGWTWYRDLNAPTEVKVNALGFTPRESTTVSLVNDTIYNANNGANGTDFTGAMTTPVTVTADGEGAVTAQITIPSSWASTDTVYPVIAGATSHYLPVFYAGVLTNGDPSLSLTDTGSSFPGGAVTVAGGGYSAGETVVVALHSATVRAVQLGTLTADSGGLISGSVYLPTGISPGSYRVWAGAKVIGYTLLNTPLTIGSAPATSRIAGSDRYQTAVATSQSFAPFATGLGTVYLSSGDTFPDALGAGALAAEIGAPVLLTSPGSLPDSVSAELMRLHPAHVKVVGGTGAVSDGVFAQVQGLLFTHDTTRLGGADRYATNRLLISNALTTAPTVYIAVGSNFPDALAAGPAAAQVSGAVVLVDGSASTLDQPTLALLTSLSVTHVRIVGGTGAISTGIQSQLNTLYPGNVTRLAGTDRYDTAAQIVADAWPSTAPTVILASGDNFPDALAAGALGLPMLTSQPNCVPAVILARLGALQPTNLKLIGGTGALSDNVKNFAHC